MKMVGWVATWQVAPTPAHSSGPTVASPFFFHGGSAFGIRPEEEFSTVAPEGGGNGGGGGKDNSGTSTGGGTGGGGGNIGGAT